MIETRVRLLFDACRQAGRDNRGANCAACTLYDMCSGQLARVGRASEAIGQHPRFIGFGFDGDGRPGRD